MADPTDEEIAEATERGDEIFEEFMDSIEGESDPVGVAYSLWVNLSRFLATAGWTGPELARDVEHHAAAQTSEGTA
jgi:hypothetical protein